MESLSKAVLATYFVLFLTVALLYRSYVVYKQTGINALKQSPVDGTLRVVAIVLKVHLLLVAGLVADHVLGWRVLTANRFEWIPADLGGGLGSAFLVLSLAVIVTAQTQMSQSWRIEIDTQNEARLVTGGLFEFSRNPIFAALRLAYFAMFLIIPCPYSLATFLIADGCFQVQARKEEQYLRALHGDDYLAYCARVRRWL